MIGRKPVSSFGRCLLGFWVEQLVSQPLPAPVGGLFLGSVWGFSKLVPHANRCLGNYDTKINWPPRMRFMVQLQKSLKSRESRGEAGQTYFQKGAEYLCPVLGVKYFHHVRTFDKLSAHFKLILVNSESFFFISVQVLNENCLQSTFVLVLFIFF